ncbi:hypothetical protein [Paracoccus sp. (in: a-proteobacteria)]|uniref:hypothetical protein n=1 Tax=Paracoccus sp. TaxID=267 RepID=UPI0026E0919D|nr:hypothetical protein [Paracoccus sp. (in: a-proteobacteria)]MDO5647362.1 hypothetical protein [Paracoccus sp. (in: a-proteobacteria)]
MKEALQDAGDATAILVVVGSVSHILPPVAALLAIIWTIIRIFEWVRFRIFKITEGGVFK